VNLFNRFACKPNTKHRIQARFVDLTMTTPKYKKAKAVPTKYYVETCLECQLSRTYACLKIVKKKV
jgi:hypothetical protein